MSTGANDLLVPPRSGLRASSVGFAFLLLLSLLWPAPVIWVNDVTIDAPIGVDERSFLGREAPSWDVVFWGIAGVFALSLLHGRIPLARASLRHARGDMRLVRKRIAARIRDLRWRHFLLGLASIGFVAAVWVFLDAWLIAQAELINHDGVRMVVRLANRLGGGMNPTMIIIFFAFAGVIFMHRSWVHYAVAMTLAGLAAGLVVHILKVLVTRTRPEVWLGPFHHADRLASSFPSGHTVSAFAIASVLLFGSRSIWMRATALILAITVAAARVLSFRHWPSDVTASAVIGLFIGWYFITAMPKHEREA